MIGLLIGTNIALVIVLFINSVLYLVDICRSNNDSESKLDNSKSGCLDVNYIYLMDELDNVYNALSDFRGDIIRLEDSLPKKRGRPKNSKKEK